MTLTPRETDLARVSVLGQFGYEIAVAALN
jgi:hypothetical protein